MGQYLYNIEALIWGKHHEYRTNWEREQGVGLVGYFWEIERTVQATGIDIGTDLTEFCFVFLKK